MFQARCGVLADKGWASSIYFTSGTNVLYQAVDIAKSQFERTGQISNFDVVGALKAHKDRFPDLDSAGNEIRYVMGWSVVPPHTHGDRLLTFQPSSSLDWCHLKGNATGLGSLIVRATHDANKKPTIATLSRVCTTEAKAGCTRFHIEEKALHGEAVEKTLGDATHMHVTDQGKALRNANADAYPLAGHVYDYHHFYVNLTKHSLGRRAIKTYTECHAQANPEDVWVCLNAFKLEDEEAS